MIYPLLRSFLVRLEPERAHALTLDGLRLGHRLGLLGHDGADARPAIELMGLRFPNRIGLAAGFDKNAVAIDAIGALGFGFIEVGTVTPRAQPGQARPRVFRLPGAGAIVNRMGFPNEGAAAACARAGRRRFAGVLGINIGKNATTPLELAGRDYAQGLATAYPVADYVTVNVSSPNTSGLRQLLTPERLAPLIDQLTETRERLADAQGRRVPLLIKVSPDLAPEELHAAADVIAARGIDGVIATNTTVQRPGITGLRGAEQGGGLSGPPLRELALASVSALRARLGPGVPIIGVGGIDSVAAARQMLAAGADLLQLYTGFVYRGPALIRALARV